MKHKIWNFNFSVVFMFSTPPAISLSFSLSAWLRLCCSPDIFPQFCVSWMICSCFMPFSWCSWTWFIVYFAPPQYNVLSPLICRTRAIHRSCARRRNQMNETYQHPGKWHDILLIPNLTRSTGNHYIMSHVIRGLEGNSVYEAIVQAKNRYGWNEVNGFCLPSTTFSPSPRVNSKQFPRPVPLLLISSFTYTFLHYYSSIRI